MFRKERVTWSEGCTRKLLDLLVEERAKGDTKFDWPKLCIEMKAQTGMTFTEEQLRNHKDDLRLKFKAWEALESWNGITFDPQTNLPIADNDDIWKAYVQKYKRRGASFRKKALANLDSLRLLFTRTFAFPIGVGKFALAKASTREGFGTDDLDDVQQISKVADSTSAEQSESCPITICGKKRKCVETSSGESTERSQSIEMIRCLERLRMRLAESSLLHTPGKYERIAMALKDIEAVMVRGSAFFLDAMEFLRVGDNGEFFLALQNNEQRQMFLDRHLQYPPSEDC